MSDSKNAVLPPLQLGPHRIDVPVVLAPMAGVTNAAFRKLCRESGAGLYVSEMVTTRALVERNPGALRLITHDPEENPRSVQLYGVDPETVAGAVDILVREDHADHVDLNFGCPVPKVTRRGGGAALPWKRDLFQQIVTRAVKAAEPFGVPVTVKMRMGIDEEHITYLEAAQMAERAGVAAVALHARTAAQHYSGQADWSAIARLKETIKTIPVLGNGDIWSAEDALEMVRQTGCDGVVVGRGCQGRPWLFADLAAAFTGSDARVKPNLGEVAAVIQRHGELMVEFMGEEDRAMRELRKHMAWYFKGYAVGGELRREFAMIDSLEQLTELISRLDHSEPYPGEAAEGQRGRAGAPKRPILPEGWLDSRELGLSEKAELVHAELDTSGG